MKKFMAFVVAMAVTAVVAVQAEDAKEVQLQGKIGCSHCTYQSASKCGVSFKTADGKVYNVVKPSKDLMQARNDGGTLKVTGVVEEKDGKLFVKASKTELEK